MRKVMCQAPPWDPDGPITKSGARGPKAPDFDRSPGHVRAAAAGTHADPRKIRITPGIIRPVPVHAPLDVSSRQTAMGMRRRQAEGNAGQSQPEADRRTGPPRRGIIVSAMVMAETRPGIPISRPVRASIPSTPIPTARTIASIPLNLFNHRRVAGSDNRRARQGGGSRRGGPRQHHRATDQACRNGGKCKLTHVYLLFVVVLSTLFGAK
jgi:hypothetical protein